MQVTKRNLIWINLIGGSAVLGSYAWGLSSYPGAGVAAWGGVPDSLRPLYTASMLSATLGYLAFTAFLLLRAWPRDGADGVDGRHLNALYLTILLPSALWLPLTFAMDADPSTGLWWLIRAVLFTVGAGSLGLLAALFALKGSARSAAWWVAVSGAVAFCLQTAVLDAVVWPAFYPV